MNRHGPRATTRQYLDRRFDDRHDLGVGAFGQETLVDTKAQPTDTQPDPAEIIRYGGLKRGGIKRIATGDDAEQSGGIGRVSCHRADMIERVGQREDAVPAHPPPGRFDAGKPTEGRRKTDRSAGIRAERSVAESGRGRDARTTRRCTGPVRHAPRIAGFGQRRVMLDHRTLGHRQLAENDRPGCLKSIDHRSVAVRNMVGIDFHARC